MAVAPDPERADAKFHPRLGGLDRLVGALNEAVDIVAPPVLAAHAAADAVSLPAPVVGKIQHAARGVLLLVRIKVIVEMDAIDVVALYDIHHRAHRNVA